MRRHKIDILKHSTGRDEYGDPVDSWAPFKSNVWAKKESLIGKEFFSALTNGVQVDVKFSTGYFKGATSEMRLRCGEDLFEIVGPPVNIGDRNMELLFYCKAVV
jgi:SPP1 family predicted phage head-tail adaptor